MNCPFCQAASRVVDSRTIGGSSRSSLKGAEKGGQPGDGNGNGRGSGGNGHGNGRVGGAAVDVAVRRRRICTNLKCGKRFTTYERPEVTPRMVVKKDGVRERYSREKVLRGMMTACEKRHISTAELSQVVDWVEIDVFGGNELEVETVAIGERVSAALRELDQVAYVRFTSVYRDFADLQEFEHMLKNLRGGSKEQRQGGTGNPDRDGLRGRT